MKDAGTTLFCIVKFSYHNLLNNECDGIMQLRQQNVTTKKRKFYCNYEIVVGTP